jgi:3-(3-hydroxy-phenyl)propionate hydroxylase
VPTHLLASSLNTPDVDAFEGSMAPGAPIDDAPVIAAGAAGWV